MNGSVYYYRPESNNTWHSRLTNLVQLQYNYYCDQVQKLAKSAEIGYPYGWTLSMFENILITLLVCGDNFRGSGCYDLIGVTALTCK